MGSSRSPFQLKLTAALRFNITERKFPEKVFYRSVCHIRQRRIISRNFSARIWSGFSQLATKQRAWATKSEWSSHWLLVWMWFILIEILCWLRLTSWGLIDEYEPLKFLDPLLRVWNFRSLTNWQARFVVVLSV